jgi:hypothetical protein
MVCHAARLGLAFTLLFLAATVAFAQADEAVIRRVVDRVMRPYLSQHQIPGAIVGASLHGRRYFFSYGQATDAGAPFTAVP